MTIVRDCLPISAFRRYCGLSGVRTAEAPGQDQAAAVRLGQSLLAGCVFGMRLGGRLFAPIDAPADIDGLVAAWNLMVASTLPANRPRGDGWATIGRRLTPCFLDEEILLQAAMVGGLDFDETALAECHERVIGRLERGASNPRPTLHSLIDLDGGSWRVLVADDWTIGMVPARFAPDPELPDLLTLVPLEPAPLPIRREPTAIGVNTPRPLPWLPVSTPVPER